MSDEGLKPCPFCGGEAERFECEEADNTGGDVIGCKKCQASTRVFFGEKEGLIEAWNTRHPDPVKAELVEALEIAMVGGDYLPAERMQLEKVLAKGKEMIGRSGCSHN